MSCLSALQLSALKKIFYVLCNCRLLYPKQRGHLSLRCPNGIATDIYREINGGLQSFFRFAAERGYCTTNPVREVRRPESDPEAGARPIPEAAYQHVMQYAPTAIKRFFLLGRETGQRISDIVQMRPVDRDGAGIVLTVTKRRKDREHWIPLSPKGAAEIDSWGGFPNAPYLTTEKGKRFTPNMFRKLWNNWTSLPENTICREITPHDLRATAVCDDRLAGLPHQQIAARRAMSAQMVMHYSRHIDQRLAAGAAMNEISTRVKSTRNQSETRDAKHK